MNMLMAILVGGLLIIEGVALFYFLVPIVQYLLHLASIRKQYSNKPIKHQYSFAAIVTAHKDTRFLPPIIDSLLKQEYQQFHAYVIADDCDITELALLATDRIHILKPEPALHSKTSSIRYAIEHFAVDHEVIVIFDADNLLHPHYFLHLNRYFNNGFEAVQTHMLSKNTDSGFAKVDTVGHVYNNFTERSSKMELGLHSAILGLGIAVKSEIYRQLVYNTKLGGFDKILQVHLAKSVKQIGFAKDCMVYDEKVESGEALEKQRTRWIFTYFKYMHLGVSLLMHGLRRFQLGTFLLATSMIRPPLFLLAAASLLFTVLNFLLLPSLAWIWPATLLCFFINYAAIVSTESPQRGMLAALKFVPSMVIRQSKALLKIKSASKDFLQTTHEHVIYIDEILQREASNNQ